MPTKPKTDPVLVEELLFPKTTILRLAKNVADDAVILKDALTAIQRSATVYVNYLMMHARAEALDRGRKTVAVPDVVAALDRAGFRSFQDQVRKEADGYVKVKSKGKGGAKTAAAEPAAPAAPDAQDDQGEAKRTRP